MLLHVVSYPLITGDIARNWLTPKYKGYDIPSKEYLKIDETISDIYWTLLLPDRDVYIVSNASTTLFAFGNPWPLLLSKPIITGVGSEYIESPSKCFIQKIYDELIKESKSSAIVFNAGVAVPVSGKEEKNNFGI